MKNKKIEIKMEPSLNEIEESIRTVFKDNLVLLILGSFSIDYKGRARSYIEAGDRILIVKSDGAMIIHRPYGYKPVNWQPRVDMFRISRKNEKLIITFIRKTPREEVTITLEKVYFLIYGKLMDEATFEMHLTEEELKKAIIKNPSLIEKDLKIINEEKEVAYGKADLIGKDSKGRIVVIELKKGKIGENEVLQLYRYVKYFKELGKNVRGLIVGSGISPHAEVLLKNLGLEFKTVNIKKLSKMKYT